MNSPYLLPANTVISFSGGRTSAYMLSQILENFEGALPDNIVTVFNNTGKERHETLDFVHDIETRWGVNIKWIEWAAGAPGYRVVDYASASRNGEPFTAMLRRDLNRRDGTVGRSALANPRMRICTANLKIKLTEKFVRNDLGWKKYHTALGLRADEKNRVERSEKNARAGQTVLCPLDDAGATVQTVMDYWARAPFDLRLRQDEGNCDLCFLKSAAKISRIIAERPDLAQWWIDREIDAVLSDRPSLWRNDRPSYFEIREAVLKCRPVNNGVFDDETTCASNGCTD